MAKYRKYRTFYADAEVDVDLGEWNDEDLIEELNDRGYSVDKSTPFNEVMDDIFDLYNHWIDDRGDNDHRFNKAIREFFQKHLNKVSV